MFPELDDNFDHRIDYLNGYAEGSRDAYGHSLWLAVVSLVVFGFAVVMLFV